MEKLKVEYIVAIDTSEGLGKDIKSFYKIFESYDGIVFSRNYKTITFNNLTVNFEVQCDSIFEKNHNYFHTIFICVTIPMKVYQ